MLLGSNSAGRRKEYPSKANGVCSASGDVQAKTREAGN